ncbi:FAD binding domain-containing protein [Nonomuraea lactucae]|uniref:FAD binding domain-containing protein n=1 Tax=Nonomuraea lactucae TaxID=2249762 RepID=UPI000DE3EB5D|nr:FAD binding domain-containing protein [Nonomuraea lactucae]
MRPFEYARPSDLAQALAAAGPDTVFIAGGTTVVDLMRLDVLAPRRLVGLGDVAELRRTELDGDPVRLGAGVTMAEAAALPLVRERYPALAAAIDLAASAQIRNVATLGGNLLQKTRCPYFRDASSPCGRRRPGDACSALTGHLEQRAVLGASPHCVAPYPGDMAVALVALEASVEAATAAKVVTVQVADLFREPGDAPHKETVLGDGDIITAVLLPAPRGTSAFVKLRDRASFAFAAASAAVSLELDHDRVVAARIALGGVATRPWRSSEAESAVSGERLTPERAFAAGEAAFEAVARTHENRRGIALGARAVTAALLACRGG